MPDADHLVWVSRDARVHARDCAAVERPTGTLSAAIVTLPREKERARAMLWEASQQCSGPLIVDGQKTDGIEPMLKNLRARAEIDGQIAKAHGKLAWMATPPDLSDWTPAPLAVDGLLSWPGIFSANRVDPGSRLLADSLPKTLGPTLIDLGAGWGWLSAQVAHQVARLHMVETDGLALDAARTNVPEATAHWADVTTWQAPERADTVIMNPPFHEGRRGAPDLGQAFIVKAAHCLKPTGQLFMVANRHLPYEAHLRELFGKVVEMPGDGRFKLYHAQNPRKKHAPSPGRGRSATI